MKKWLNPEQVVAKLRQAGVELGKAMRRIADACPRFASKWVHPMLNDTGCPVGFGRVLRLWKQGHTQVTRKQRKGRRSPGHSRNGGVRSRATHRNHVRSYDFAIEPTEDGRLLKLLVAWGEYTENAYVESFNGKLPNKRLNGKLFLIFTEARCGLDG